MAGAGEQIEVEERVAVGVGGGELLRERAVDVDLVAQGGLAEELAAVFEGVLVAVEAGEGGGDEQPRGGAVVLGVAGDHRGAVAVEPGVGGLEPGTDGVPVILGQGIAVDEEGESAREFGEGDEVDDRGGGGVGGAGGVACVVEGGFEEGIAVDEVGADVLRGAGGVLRVGAEEIGRGEAGGGGGEVAQTACLGAEELGVLGGARGADVGLDLGVELVGFAFGREHTGDGRYQAR